MRFLDLFSDICAADIQQGIDMWVKNARNRAVLRDKLIDGLTYEQIAEKHGLSVRHTKTLIYRYGDFVLLHLQK